MSDFLEDIKQQVSLRVQNMSVIRNHACLVQGNTALDFCSIFGRNSSGSSGIPVVEPLLKTRYPHPCRSARAIHGPQRFSKAAQPREFRKSHSSPTIIAEIKFASPSKGTLYSGPLNAVQIAEEYVKNGASALSILTEPNYFKGNIDYIREVRTALPDVPILMKDFVLAPVQIEQAQAYGANAVLLIVAFLDPILFCELYEYAMSLGLTPLIEVHHEDELEQALELHPRVVGVNNRNLKTLQIDLQTSRRLISRIPDSVIAVCESGITSAEAIQSMTDVGFDGFLMGSYMMNNHHPGEALGTLLRRVRHAR